MVLPLIAAGIGAAGSILGGMFGANAQKEANEKNYQIALMNFYDQKQAREEALNEARRQEREGKLGTTDAAGNRTYFVPGQGWVTDLSPEEKEMRGLYRTEEMQGLGDLRAKRQKMYENLARQRGEGNYADALMEAMGRVQREDPQSIIDRRNLMSAEGINEGMDASMNTALANVLRSGSSNAGKIASDIGLERSKALRNAFMENTEGARGEAEDAYYTKLGNIGNMANQWATRATAMPDAQYNPRNIEGMAAEGGRNAMAGGKSGALMQALGGNVPQMNYQHQPSQIGNVITGGANAISAGLERIYDWKQGRDYQSQTPYYGTSGGTSGGGSSMYKPGTGLF